MAEPEENSSEPIAEPRRVAVLTDSIQLYRKHARAFVVIAGVLLVPAALVKSVSLSAVVRPAMAKYQPAQIEEAALAAVEADRAFAAAKARHAEPEVMESLAKQANLAHHDYRARMARAILAVARGARGPVARYVLTLAGVLAIMLFFNAVLVPLTSGALIIAAADRARGGNAGWREVWMLLFRRLEKLIVTALCALLVIVPAVAITALTGAITPLFLVPSVWALFAILPGAVFAFLFAFMSPVVLLDGVGGFPALGRSARLVRSNWRRVLWLMVIVGVLRFALVKLPEMLSSTWPDSLGGDAFTILLLPLSSVAMALVYVDLRDAGLGSESVTEP